MPDRNKLCIWNSTSASSCNPTFTQLNVMLLVVLSSVRIHVSLGVIRVVLTLNSSPNLNPCAEETHPLLQGATKSMVIDFGVLVEGKAEDELPERLIGACKRQLWVTHLQVECRSMAQCCPASVLWVRVGAHQFRTLSRATNAQWLLATPMESMPPRGDRPSP